MLATVLCVIVGFHAPPTSISRCSASRCSAPLLAEGGPPQIEWQDASVVSNEQLARGTMQLRLRASAPHGYRAGHILGSWLSFEPGTHRSTDRLIRCSPRALSGFEMAHPESGEGLKGPCE